MQITREQYQSLNAQLVEMAREIEVLTLERDNALLERDRAEVALAEHLADYGDPRGGVHPNA